jgi:ribosomal protein L37AE/L43A
MSNVRYGSTSPTGTVNNLRLRCGKCGTEQYVRPGSDPWVCYACKHKQ